MINALGASTPGHGIPPLPAVNTPLGTRANASSVGGQTPFTSTASGAQAQTTGNGGSGLPGVVPSTATSSPTQPRLSAADGTTGTGGTGGTTGTGSTSPTTPQDLSGTDTFLKLLVAQLRNQDPSQPMDDQAFITELAQFNTVEQMINLKQSMDAQVASQQAGEGVALLGKSITYTIPGIGGNNSTTGQGTVSGVSLQGGHVMLQIGAQTVPLAEVLTVGDPSTSSLAPAASSTLPSITPATGALPSAAFLPGISPSITTPTGSTAGAVSPGALPYATPMGTPSAGTLPISPSMGTLPITPSTGTLP